MLSSVPFVNAPVPFEQIPEKTSAIQQESFLQKYGYKIGAALAALAAAVAYYLNLPEAEPVQAGPREKRKPTPRRQPRHQVATTKEAFAAARRIGDTALKQWIDKGLDVNLRDEHNNTLLMEAAKHGRITNLELLLEQPGIDINAQNNDDNTALMLAAQAGKLKTVQALLLKHADKNMTNQQGKTAKDLTTNDAIQGYIDRAG